jgi:hypothetical protein
MSIPFMYISQLVTFPVRAFLSGCLIQISGYHARMSQSNHQVPEKLLEFLVCPIIHSQLKQEGSELVAQAG